MEDDAKEEQPTRTDQLRLADRLSRLLSSSSSVTELCEGVASELGKLMSLDWAAIALSDEASAAVRLSPLSRHISCAWELGETILLPGSPVAHLIEGKRTVMEPDLEQASRFPTGVSFLKEGIKSVVYVPLFSAGIVFGGLIVGSRRANAYGDRELRLLWFTGALIALPIENEKLRREMVEKEERLAAIRKLTGLVSAGGDAEKLVEQFGRQLKDIVPLDYVSISRVEGRQAETLGVYDATPTKVTEELTFPLNETPLGWLTTSKKPFVTPDLRIETGFPSQELFVKAGLRSGIFLPLFSGEDVIGCLQVCSSQPDAYGKREQRFLEELAAEIAIPVKNIYLRASLKESEIIDEAIIHELTTHVTPIIASSAMLSDELGKGADTTQSKLVQSILNSANELKLGLSGLLELARVKVLTAEEPTGPVDMRALLRQAVVEVHPIVDARHQVIVLELPATLPTVEANGPSLKQMLFGLLDIVSRVSLEQNEIVAAGTIRGNRVVTELRFHNRGDVDFGKRYSLLHVYKRSRPDRQAHPHLALHLTVARRLVERQQGRFWIEPKPDRTTAFCLSLRITKG